MTWSKVEYAKARGGKECLKMVTSKSQDRSESGQRWKKSGRLKILLFVLILVPMAISSSNNKSSLTVVNRTDLYLHLIVDGHSYLYLAPDREFNYESEPKGEYYVRAFYSPGQRSNAVISRTIAVPYYSGSTGCGYSSQGGITCSATPEHGGSALWEVTPDTMLFQPDGGKE
jgi:hypothetical protein